VEQLRRHPRSNGTLIVVVATHHLAELCEPYSVDHMVLDYWRLLDGQTLDHGG
jgi:hypothetical protein